MATMNEIVSSISSRVGRPFDVPLQRELKHIVRYHAAMQTHRYLDKYPWERNLFLQEVIIPVEKANPSECPDIKVPGKCFLLKTTKPVPRPIRNITMIYDYVGAVSGRDPYAYLDPAFADFIQYNRYTKDRPKWFYINDKIYLINEGSDKFTLVRGVFEDPFSINACGDPKCFTDDDPYPIASDLLPIIVESILKVEMNRLFPEEENVDADKDVTPEK